MINNDNLDSNNQDFSVHEIIISSEQEAWKVIEDYHSTKYNINGRYKLVIHAQDIIKRKAVGDKYHNTITPAMMKAYLELQKNIYKSFALVKYNSNNPKKLTKEEKDRLEILLKVKHGSSEFEFESKDIITLLEKVLTGMESIHIVFVIVTFFVLYFGRSAWNDYLQHKLEIRKNESKDQKDKEMLNHCNFISQEDTKKMDILRDIALNGNDKVRTMLKNSEESNEYFLKAATDTDKFVVYGTEISSDIAKKIANKSQS